MAGIASVRIVFTAPDNRHSCARELLTGSLIGATIVNKIAAVLFAYTLVVSGGASAASLLTTDAGYTGPVLDIGSYGDAPYILTNGPLQLPGGINLTSSNTDAVVGVANFALAVNGISDGPIVGLSDGNRNGVIKLTFKTPTSSFGVGFNYAPNTGRDPIISAFNAMGNLIASYDLATTAPISTPGEVDAFEFRGIDGGGSLIKSFKISGSYVVAEAVASDVVVPQPPSGAIPEPTTWMLAFVGFVAVGISRRCACRRYSCL